MKETALNVPRVVQLFVFLCPQEDLYEMQNARNANLLKEDD